MSKEKVRKILENFLSEMANAKKSRHTIVNYRSDLVHFLNNCSSGIENLTVENLRSHLDGLNSKSPTTKARHISSLTSFLNWSYRKDYIPSNPILKIDSEKPIITHTPKKIEKNSIENVICSIEIFNKNNSININNLKYRLLFTLMIEAGLKVSEALRLNFEDIESETLTVLVNSTPKRRVTLFSSESVKLLELYKNEIGISSGFIFKVSYHINSERPFISLSAILLKIEQQSPANLYTEATAFTTPSISTTTTDTPILSNIFINLL
jgi:site-specific recombinase XerD